MKILEVEVLKVEELHCKSAWHNGESDRRAFSRREIEAPKGLHSSGDLTNGVNEAVDPSIIVKEDLTIE